MEIFEPLPENWPLLSERAELEAVQGEVMDRLWKEGWRHFGAQFFRYSLMWQEERWKRVFPLRLSLAAWKMSKSQRRTWRRNEDVEVQVEPAQPGGEERDLFHRHKERFRDNVPENLEVFLGEQPNGIPCECRQVSVRLEGRLIAASYLDVGKRSCSSIYAFFDLEESRRRLGVFTMLAELAYARERGLDFYYSGYATVEQSPYDYKKEVRGIEWWPWRGGWDVLSESSATVVPDEEANEEQGGR
ncbi:MAG: arginine-tRNA-protein transferase [Verrucomicrobiota bacterium]